MRFLIQMMVLLIAFGCPHSFAAVSDIDFSKMSGIPQAEDLKKNASELEPLAKEWSSEWKHDVPKEQAIELAKKTIALADDVIKDKPDHAEMLIFKGMMAHYAYNLDLQEYNDIAEKSFKAAQALLPDDIRPRWFLGKHYTLSARPALGMQTITPIIKKNAPEQLPARFWEDYAFCAYLAAMPSSALMGIDYSEKLPLNKQGEPKPQFFRAREVFARFNRPMYYMIVLDAPESAYPEARKELDLVLAGFSAE